MNEILENTPHAISETICLKCLRRSITVRPEYVWLKNLECECGETGFIINTGQPLESS